MDNDNCNPTYHNPRRAIAGNDCLDIRMMTLEERYAAQWRKDARKEGHRKGLPPSPSINTSPLKKPEAYAKIIAAIRDGVVTIAHLTIATGYSRQLVHDRLRWLRENGKVVSENNQWRILE